ncbi:Crp/Fnr family transcriptional regulator [Shewanella glacialipiscicola]|uniref:Cyclic nucleotide-binding protein n=1 Tax=Shewanella glacialipiscicola TaxID=614069 RepID=A0ABQ6J4G9_9GAMM|nr:Crp/Fnr family transcriptional regulator [Shewanella glacialipiscicola]MCL1087652.1 Crp/Fnr family transcriptional regulator [Shewanella glacialipiscicola]GIU11929.1 cyclic nucleotide-binding protein [Shewanella glacialipiscicola]GMA81745.1 cyclic nucleotide-binding protein [Shewanella glacialipiscicola]
MQLKPLAKGRFNQRWEQDYPLIERVIMECVTETKALKKGVHLMTQGQAFSSLVFVKQGRVSLGHTARNGRCFQLGTMNCDSQLFGEMEFFTQYRCQLDIIANEPLEIAIISGDKLQLSLTQHPQLALFFASAMAIDYQDTVDIFTRRMLYPISYNIAFDLYHQHLNDLPVDGFTKRYLEAERFATTDRVYRRAIKNLEELGLIEREKDSIRIFNLNALKAFVEQGE